LWRPHHFIFDAAVLRLNRLRLPIAAKVINFNEAAKRIWPVRPTARAVHLEEMQYLHLGPNAESAFEVGRSSVAGQLVPHQETFALYRRVGGGARKEKRGRRSSAAVTSADAASVVIRPARQRKRSLMGH
jgi:hypothetical protein